MNKLLFFLITLTGLLLTQKNILLSDQPNGEPWTENSSYEGIHENIDGIYKKLKTMGLCYEISCILLFDELHESQYEVEEDDEEESEYEEAKEFHSEWKPFWYE